MRTSKTWTSKSRTIKTRTSKTRTSKTQQNTVEALVSDHLENSEKWSQLKRPRGKTIEGGLRMLMVTHSTVAKILNNFYCLFQKRIAYIQVNEPSVLMLWINLIKK